MVEATSGELSPEQADALMTGLSAALDRDADVPFWRLVDGVARLRGMTDRELALVADILIVVGRHASPPLRTGRRRRTGIEGA
jgi:hypothetical protein